MHPHSQLSSPPPRCECGSKAHSDQLKIHRPREVGEAWDSLPWARHSTTGIRRQRGPGDQGLLGWAQPAPRSTPLCLSLCLFMSAAHQSRAGFFLSIRETGLSSEELDNDPQWGLQCLTPHKAPGGADHLPSHPGAVNPHNSSVGR